MKKHERWGLLRRAIPPLCCTILAAHFLRERNLTLMLLSLAGIPFLFIGREWAARALQVFFVLASLEWVHTTFLLVAERKALGLPWIRMALILTAVAALTLFSALLVRGRKPNDPDSS